MPRASFTASEKTGAASSSFAPASIAAYKVQEKYEAGVRLLQAGHVRSAIQQFQEASFFDAQDARPIVALAECYVFLCDLRSAIRCYRRALWSLRRRPQKGLVRKGVRASRLLSAEAIASLLSSLTPPQEALSLPPELLSAPEPVEEAQDVEGPASAEESLPQTSVQPPSPHLSVADVKEGKDAAAEEPVAVQEPFASSPPPPRPTTAQFTPPTAFLSGEALTAMVEGRALSTQEAADAPVESIDVSTPLPTEVQTDRGTVAASATEAEECSTDFSQPPSTPSSPTEAPNWSGQNVSHVIASSAAPPSQSTAPHALTASEVRCRLAGVLDALGLALFQVGSVEQALRCTTEALELIAAAEAEEGAEAAGAGAGGNTPFFAKASNPYLSEPIIALHRAVFLIALQYEEEAEVLLTSHYQRFSSCRTQSAPLLIQLFCNRQAFRKARLLLETQEEGFQAAVLRAERAAAAAASSEERTSPVSFGGTASIEDRSSSNLPLAKNEDDCPAERLDTSTAFPALSSPASLTVAKFIFTELYARYRSAALASDDEDSVTRCLDVYPNDVDLLFRRAQLRIAAGDLKQSIKDLFTCVQDTNGEHKAAIEAMTTVLFTIGSSLDGESEVQNAVTYYSESLKWRPDNLLVLVARGDCYTKMEAFEEALADYNAILNYAPGHREAQGRIAALHDLWGRKFYAMDSVTQAEVEFTNAIKADGSNPEFYYHRALCRLRLNQGQYALRDVLSCKELRPTAPHLRAFIARYMEPTQQLDDEVQRTAAEREEAERRQRKNAAHRTAAVASDGSRHPASPSTTSGAAAKWYGARTPPPPPAPSLAVKVGGSGRHRRAASRGKGAESGGDYAASETSTTSPSSAVLLPPISNRSRARTANDGGWVQGCQTMLHRRQREEALSQTK